MASPSFAAIFIGYSRAKWGPERLPDYHALNVYYKQIAVQVGNGDPELYSFGYPYIEAILNTPPGGTPPDDPEDPGDPPTPDPEAYYVSGVSDAGFMMRWKYEGDQFFNLLHIPYFEWETVFNGGEEEAYQNATTIINSYFLNRAIVLPPEMDAYSAVWWTGQFLEYYARNQHDTDLDIMHMIGADKIGRKYSARDFDRAAVDIRSLIQGARLISTE